MKTNIVNVKQFKTFELTWENGQKDLVAGRDFNHAVKRAGLNDRDLEKLESYRDYVKSNLLIK